MRAQKILWLTWKDREHPQAGGAEVVNDELAARLARDGHEVVFFVAGFRGAAPETTRRGYRIVRVGRRFTSYLAAVPEYLRRWQGWPDLVIDECNTMPYFAHFYTMGRQVLFFHMLNRQIWFYEFPQPFSTIGWLAEPVYLRLLSRRVPIVAMSDSTRRDLIRHGFPKQNIHVISEGIEMERVEELTESKFREPTVLIFGSVRPMKRTLHGFEAFELAKAKIPDLKLIIAGDHSSRYGRRVLAAAHRSPHAADIEVTGPVSQARKAELMQRSHALLATSVKEGWCLVVTEAASQGTPAVVYDVDGLRDSVQDGLTGLVAVKNSPRALAASLVSLLADPARYALLRRAAWEASAAVNFERSYDEFKDVLGLS
jgi:glycosyltransferase involved in cell wall biosynthesis